MFLPVCLRHPYQLLLGGGQCMSRRMARISTMQPQRMQVPFRSWSHARHFASRASYSSSGVRTPSESVRRTRSTVRSYSA